MKPNEIIRRRRIDLGLDEREVAARTRLSIHEYGDIEQYPDEFTSVLDVATAKRLCDVLGLSVHDVLGGDSSRSQAVPDNTEKRKRLRDARDSSGLTIDELAEKLGVEPSVIKELETDPTAIERRPLKFVQQVAAELKLPFPQLIA